MKVKEVIDKCQELLEVENTKDDLLMCLNLVESELATDYLPLYETHNCNSNTVKFSELKYKPIRIVSCNCRYKIYPTYIESKENITEIKYTYIPSKKDLHDECSYNDMCFKCLVYGTIAEFLCSQGFYEEAAQWSEKYKREIKLLTF